MALNEITYEDKVSLNPQPIIANKNKVSDDDMNEIKSVVNAGVVVESGTNANGNYIKYGDGTMICWDTKTYYGMQITGGYQGVYYANTGSITFPQEFIEAPHIIATAHIAGGGYSMYGGVTGSAFSGFVWKTQSATINVPLTWTAYGKWKA